MKICACIAEYNPFHLGHLKHIDYMKTVLGAEKIIVLMSGNFTQRGEIAVLDKFTRARQAIIAGADMVIELPTVFATSNAETFAKGGVNIIDALGVCDGLCFGIESGDKESYLSLAKAMNNESKDFKRALKEQLEKGVSLAKAKFLALLSLGATYDESLISSPNNILGLEYTKALLKINSNIDVYPMLRDGNHNDVTLKKGITSASSIRECLKTGTIKKAKKSMPPFVFKDLKDYPFLFEKLAMAKIILSPAEELKQISDCTEGLENRIKAFSKDILSLDELVEKVSTKRYTKARIRRIITANLLGIKQDFVTDCLNSKLYAKVLAVDSNSLDLISLLSKKSSIPILTRKSDLSALKKTAEKCFQIDVLANDIYNLVSSAKQNENQMLII
ncbi:MAG: nucleotidyltransferase family protein [Clostridia bacterium]|nr:nucleotidyltransferase family protein [Clostridia bacterium]